MKLRLLSAACAVGVLIGCANQGTEARSASASSDAQANSQTKAAPARYTPPADPYPSTYRPYPSVPTAITGATVFDGEGARIENGTVVMAEGRIVAIGGPDTPIPEGATRIDGAGRFVTPGIIDTHSHLGNYPQPGVDAHSDGNEATNPVRAEVWAEHSVWPQDPGFTRALANGGVTTLQVLPGSANLFGGRSVVLRNVPGRTVMQMRFPGAPRGLKMACGENPKRVYGGRNTMPQTRMGNVAMMRATWLRAVEYRDRRAREPNSTRDYQLDTLVEVLNGDILIHNHCYRADEMAIMLDMAREFGFRIASFHHAVEAYKIADLLRESNTCASVWADWWGFKMEAYDAINENAPMVHAAGACAIIHSDDPNGIQRLNQEAGKALADGRRMGLNISDEDAWRWLSLNPARSMGIENETGSLRAGKRADVVMWNGNPYSVYTRPQQVWIDGALLYDMNNPRLRPVTDFELGQPGEGDVK